MEAESSTNNGSNLTLYCISGLGGDERAFNYLKLDGVEVKHLNWIIPDTQETIETYADKMLALIDRSKTFGLVGLSFGGMIATEMAKKIKPSILILLSSAMTADELPLLYRLGGKTGLYRIIAPTFIKNGYFIFNWLRNSRKREKRKLLGDMIKQNDNRFLGWAIKTVSNWQNTTAVECIRIHGSKDLILPKGKYMAQQTVKGGHLIVMSHPREVSAFINQTIKTRFGIAEGFSPNTIS